MSCRGTITIKGVKQKNCFIGVVPGLYTSLTNKDYEIPILLCGTLQLQILRSTNIADLITVIPMRIYSDGNTTIVEPKRPISKSNHYNVKTSFDDTHTLMIELSSNWDNGNNLSTSKKPWLIVGIFISLSLLMIVILVLLAISMTEAASLKQSEKSARLHYIKR